MKSSRSAWGCQPGLLVAAFAAMFAARIEAAQYWVAPSGDDLNSGSQLQPWRTVQKGVDSAASGDEVVVRAGRYAERVQSKRAGVGGRIRFRGEAGAIVSSWLVNHSNITVTAFEINGYSGASVTDGFVEVKRDGDGFELLDCVIRDGFQIVRRDLVFTESDRKITSAEGGFIAAGFAPGQTVYVGKGTNSVTVSNLNVFRIGAVTDNQITVTGVVVNEGPLHGYLSASYQYGLVIQPGAERCLIRSNEFRNLGYDGWFIMGSENLLEGNRLEQVNGWDAMHFGGTNQVFRGNIFRQSPLLVYQVSPDAWENYSPAPYFNILFTNNFIMGFDGVLSSQKGSGHSSGLTVSRNVFVDVGGFFGSHPGTRFEHNTFLRVARTNNPVVSVTRHSLNFAGSSAATNIVIRNNVFVDCGQISRGLTEANLGWYDYTNLTSTYIADGNFAAGAAPNYQPKIGWVETNSLLNGGDPGFRDQADPLGPDGMPFSADDGLKLLHSSKLVGAGTHGATPGAYEASVQPVLSINVVSPTVIRLSWPVTEEAFQLETAMDVLGTWSAVQTPPALRLGRWEVDLTRGITRQFFRLSR